MDYLAKAGDKKSILWTHLATFFFQTKEPKRPINYDVSYSANVNNFCEMESRAGGLVRLPGSVGARPEGQSGAGLPVPVCHRVGLRRQLC